MNILQYITLFILLLHPLFSMAQIKTLAQKEAEIKELSPIYKPNWPSDINIMKIMFAPYDSSYMNIPRYSSLEAYKKFIGQKIYYTGNDNVYFFSDRKNDVTIEHVGNAPFKIKGKTYLYGKVSDMRCGIDHVSRNNVVELDYNTKNNILERVTYDSSKEQYYTIIDVISADSERFREHNTIKGVYRLPIGENEKMLVEFEIEEQEKEIARLEKRKTELSGVKNLFSITGAASIRERKEIPDAIEICKKKIEELKKELEPSDRSAYFAGEEYKEGEEVRFGLLQNITNTVKYYYPESFEDDVKYGYYLSEMGTDAASYKLRIDLGNEQKMDSIPYFILRNEKNGDTVYTTGLSIYPSYNPNNSIILVGAFVKLQQKYIGLKLYRLSQIPTLANMNSDLIQETWKCVDVLLDKHGEIYLTLQQIGNIASPNMVFEENRYFKSQRNVEDHIQIDIKLSDFKSFCKDLKYMPEKEFTKLMSDLQEENETMRHEQVLRAQKQKQKELEAEQKALEEQRNKAKRK